MLASPGCVHGIEDIPVVRRALEFVFPRRRAAGIHTPERPVMDLRDRVLQYLNDSNRNPIGSNHLRFCGHYLGERDKVQETFETAAGDARGSVFAFRCNQENCDFKVIFLNPPSIEELMSRVAYARSDLDVLSFDSGIKRRTAIVNLLARFLSYVFHDLPWLGELGLVSRTDAPVTNLPMWNNIDGFLDHPAARFDVSELLDCIGRTVDLADHQFQKLKDEGFKHLTEALFGPPENGKTLLDDLPLNAQLLRNGAMMAHFNLAPDNEGETTTSPFDGYIKLVLPKLPEPETNGPDLADLHRRLGEALRLSTRLFRVLVNSVARQQAANTSDGPAVHDLCRCSRSHMSFHPQVSAAVRSTLVVQCNEFRTELATELADVNVSEESIWTAQIVEFPGAGSKSDHVLDYLVSQGIRVDLEQLPKRQGPLDRHRQSPDYRRFVLDQLNALGDKARNTVTGAAPYCPVARTARSRTPTIYTSFAADPRVSAVVSVTPDAHAVQLFSLFGQHLACFPVMVGSGIWGVLVIVFSADSPETCRSVQQTVIAKGMGAARNLGRQVDQILRDAAFHDLVRVVSDPKLQERDDILDACSVSLTRSLSSVGIVYIHPTNDPPKDDCASLATFADLEASCVPGCCASTATSDDLSFARTALSLLAGELKLRESNRAYQEYRQMWEKGRASGTDRKRHPGNPEGSRQTANKSDPSQKQDNPGAGRRRRARTTQRIQLAFRRWRGVPLFHRYSGKPGTLGTTLRT